MSTKVESFGSGVNSVMGEKVEETAEPPPPQPVRTTDTNNADTTLKRPHRRFLAAIREVLSIERSNLCILAGISAGRIARRVFKELLL
jgi:hypothetical protein